MQAALIVGIDYYEHVSKLNGCVNDAHSVKAVLERHHNGQINFECSLLTGTGKLEAVTKGKLKDSITKLFDNKNINTALFYFAGHGSIETTGGYLLTSDVQRVDDGVPLSEILTLANKSPAKNKIIILDSCYSGALGATSNDEKLSNLSEGLTILTASTQHESALEKNGRGVFTTLLVDALNGSAANLIGDITPGSVYAHIDQSLGPWEQRPVFKTNVKQFVSLRKARPPISIEDLRQITNLFPSPGFEFRLDPTFEPETKGKDKNMPEPIPDNTRKFAILQKYNRLNLVIPEGAPHMWNAAMESKSCKLTVLGEHYRMLVEKGRI